MTFDILVRSPRRQSQFDHELPVRVREGLVCGRGARSVPALDRQSACLLCLLTGDPSNGLAKGPDMPLRISRAIGAISIQLVRRLLKDHRARLNQECPPQPASVPA